MKGYELTFFTQQNRFHRHRPLAVWLIEEARRLGLRGATLIDASEGFGQHRKIHSTRFFELADQPQQVLVVVTSEEMTRLFQRLQEEQIQVFYVKAEIEFGTIGADSDAEKVPAHG
jgi:PII-like signaling protein